MGWGTVSVKIPACQHCGRLDEYHDILEGYTHNCNKMMRRALKAVGNLEALGADHLYALNGMGCLEVAELLMPAIEWWDAHHEELTKLNPENGWGDEKSAFQFWSSLAKGCMKFPRGTLCLQG